jgi:thiosulfate dehydrogenase (quinone) large subunit
LRPDTTGGGNRRSHGRVADGWLEMPWSIRILRAFLGVTFVFAGMQKFLDPNFLRVGGGDYIGTQLAGFANGTPAAPLMRILEHGPVLTGIAIAVLEIAVGLGTLAGVGMLAATSVGFAINTTLWLSATWHTHPYFLGSDSIYAVAWLALAAGVVEVEHAHRGHVAGPIERIEGISRREFVRGTLVGGVAAVLGIAAAALAGPSSASGIAALTDRTTGGGGSSAGSRSPTAAPTSAPPVGSSTPGKVLTTLDRLPVGQAVGFTDPNVGSAVLLRLGNDDVVAYSRSCTHEGCLVGYDPSAQILVCPCHGAEFDPAHQAEAIAGPTRTPLTPIKVVVDASTGDVVLPI